jgi:hypothetical protein
VKHGLLLVLVLAGCASRHDVTVELTGVCSAARVHYSYTPHYQPTSATSPADDPE